MDKADVFASPAALMPNISKISLLVPKLSGGGAERMMVNLANEFAKEGYPTDLVLLQQEGPYLDEVSSAVRVVNLNALRPWNAVYRFRKYLQEVRPCGVLSTLVYGNLVACIACQMSRNRPQLVIREANSLVEIQKRSRSLRSMIWAAIIPYVYRRADLVVGVSKGVTGELRHNMGIPENRVRTIYNPVVTPGMQEAVKEGVEHPWFHDEEVRVVLAAGVLTLQKDFATLIRAFSHVLQREEARLVILGEGPERWRLEGLARQLGISEHVSMPGFDRNPFKYMAKARVFVLSSQYEGLPGVLIQALAVGCPVVSTDCDHGPREILEGGRWGKLVPVGDHRTMAKAILETLTGKDVVRGSKRGLDFSVHLSATAYLEALGGG
jgi:glycosyltransferase involved in cell wall biosynthesis